MNKENKVGVLFDLDGVLIDSEREYSKIWRRVNEEYPTGVENLETVIKGCTLEKILADHYPDEMTARKVTERLYQLESQMHYEFKPGAEELLHKLSALNVAKVLVTSSNADKMRHLYEEIPYIEGLFDYIVTANLISHSKPDPEGYLLGASLISCSPVNCIVFEDSLQGVKAGKNAGALVVGVAGTLPEKVLMPYSDMVVDTLESLDILTLIDTASKR